MSKVNVFFSKQTIGALEHFASLLEISRKNKSFTIEDLASRVGISKSTAIRILKGSPKVNIGVYFETARIVGVPLFDADPSRFEISKKKTKDIESLLPKRVRPKEMEIDNDF
jgi:transcriptional regulator with XRE-family HTH domain